MWRIKQVLNNNVVLAAQADREAVLVGTGIAFGKRKGDEVYQEQISQIFAAEDTQPAQLARLVAELSPQQLELASKISSLAARICEIKLPDSTVVAIADHLRFAVDRAIAGTPLPNPLKWEVQQFYPEEYQFGQRALELIKAETGIQCDESEAVSLALHVVNAAFAVPGGSLVQTAKITEMLNKVFAVVEAALAMEIDRESAAAARFVTHIRFLLRRMLRRGGSGAHEPEPALAGMRDTIAKTYPKSWSAAAKLVMMLQMELDTQCSDDEIVYLALHIARLAGATK